MSDESSLLTISRVANVLQRAGYEATIEWEADFICVRTRSSDYYIIIYLYTDDDILERPMLDDELCVELTFSSNWGPLNERDANDLVMLCNEFNSERNSHERFAKAYILIIDDYRRLSLDANVFAKDGISDQSIILLYKRFIDISEKFRRRVEEN